MKLKFKKREYPEDNNFTFYQAYNKKGEILGLITNENWNRWTWEQFEGVIMSRGCLKEVSDFMEKLGGKP